MDKSCLYVPTINLKPLPSNSVKYLFLYSGPHSKFLNYRSTLFGEKEIERKPDFNYGEEEKLTAALLTCSSHCQVTA